MRSYDLSNEENMKRTQKYKTLLSMVREQPRRIKKKRKRKRPNQHQKNELMKSLRKTKSISHSLSVQPLRIQKQNCNDVKNQTFRVMGFKHDRDNKRFSQQLTKEERKRTLYLKKRDYKKAETHAKKKDKIIHEIKMERKKAEQERQNEELRKLNEIFTLKIEKVEENASFEEKKFEEKWNKEINTMIKAHKNQLKHFKFKKPKFKHSKNISELLKLEKHFSLKCNDFKKSEKFRKIRLKELKQEKRNYNERIKELRKKKIDQLKRKQEIELGKLYSKRKKEHVFFSRKIEKEMTLIRQKRSNLISSMNHSHRLEFLKTNVIPPKQRKINSSSFGTVLVKELNSGFENISKYNQKKKKKKRMIKAPSLIDLYY